MTHIDTAQMYGDAELLIAGAIAAGKRDDLISSSRCCRATHRGVASSPAASD
jgi:diketogulonate reductase-like aldo/keto reductase